MAKMNQIATTAYKRTLKAHPSSKSYTNPVHVTSPFISRFFAVGDDVWLAAARCYRIGVDWALPAGKSAHGRNIEHSYDRPAAVAIFLKQLLGLSIEHETCKSMVQGPFYCIRVMTVTKIPPSSYYVSMTTRASVL
jgi:hypothetical protein